MKAALTKLTEHAAMELARYKIRVNTIAPGWTDTGAARLGDKESTYYKIPLKRWCHPEEIGEAAVFLSSEADVYKRQARETPLRRYDGHRTYSG